MPENQIETKNYAKYSRFSAYLVDFFIFNSFFLLLLFIFLNSSKSLGNILIALNIYLGLSLLYIFLNAWLFKNFGGSLGKIMCGLEVIKEENGSYLNFYDYFFREAIAKLFSNMLFFLGHTYILYHPKKQGFHDLMAATVVLKKSTLRPIIMPIITFAIFVLLLFLMIFKISNEKLLGKIDNHVKVLGAQSEYQIQKITK